MSNPDPRTTPPPPEDEGEEALGTVSAFELTAQREHLLAEHAGDFEDCSEEDCVQARDMLGGKQP